MEYLLQCIQEDKSAIDFDTPDPSGQTPLHFAFRYGNPEMIKLIKRLKPEKLSILNFATMMQQAQHNPKLKDMKLHEIGEILCFNKPNRILEYFNLDWIKIQFN